MLLLESGNIEANTGPRKSFITFCHWNLNVLAAHAFVKMEAFITTHNFNAICLSETFLYLSMTIQVTPNAVVSDVLQKVFTRYQENRLI